MKENIRNKKMALADLKRDMGDELRLYSAEQIREWVRDILREWKSEREWEIQTYGAPYHLAVPS